jgi:rhodanese-related sulfurtransferase
MNQISITELYESYKKNTGIIVDIREEGEYLKEHIPKSVNIQVRELYQYLLKFKKEIPVYIICEKGGRSIGAALSLKMKGVEATCVSPGGITQWKENKFPLKTVF